MFPAAASIVSDVISDATDDAISDVTDDTIHDMDDMCNADASHFMPIRP